MSKINRCTALLTAILATAGVTPVFAQDADARHDASAKLIAQFMEDARALQAASEQAGSIDRTPPVLHNVETTGSVNAQLVDQYVTVTIKATDGNSGVISYMIEYRSPSGMHHIAVLKTAPTPRPNLTSTLTVGAAPYSEPPFLRFAEPGTWVADMVIVKDAAGNVATYNEAQLRGFGSNTFFVTNNGGYDITPPTLASGLIDTPNVRLSKPPKGLPDGTPPYVTAEVSMTDTGNGIVSGSFEGYLKFCLPGCSDSFVMYGRTNRTGLVANTLTVGAQLKVGQTPGNYQIDSLEMIDSAGSSRTLTSNVFGGSTDFHGYFPQGVTVFLNQ